MIPFFFRKLFHFIIVFIFSLFLVFSILYFTPQDAANLKLGLESSKEALQKERQKLGIQTSFNKQLYYYIKNLTHGNFGNSYRSGLPVITEIKSHLKNTLLLSFFAMTLSLFLGLFIGTVTANKAFSKMEKTLSFINIVIFSFPSFLISLILIYFFSLKFHLFPFIGLESFQNFILPVLSISLISFVPIARVTKTSLYETLHTDYYKIAQLNRIKKSVLFWHYLIKNSIMPILTITALEFWGFLGGMVITETIFSFPGIGLLLTHALNQKDVPVIMGCMVVFIFIFCAINFLIDLMNEMMIHKSPK